MIAALAQNGKFKQIVDLNDFDLSKPSQTDQKTVISDLNGQKISNLQDVGFIGWIKITDAPDNDISYIIQSGYTAGDAITIVPFNAQFSMKNKLISYQCDMGSTYSPQKGTSQITIQKWFFFMCSFDIQNKVLRIFTYQEGTKVTSKLDLKDFSSLSAISIKDWEINYAMQSINKSKWIGNLRNIQFFYNINFSEFDSSFLSLVYGRYQMKYFLPFDTRRGNTIYDQNQGYSFPLKYKTVDPPAFELDGMGITYSALNQSIQLDNIELSSSIFISFWIKVCIINYLSVCLSQ